MSEDRFVTLSAWYAKPLMADRSCSCLFAVYLQLRLCVAEALRRPVHVSTLNSMRMLILVQAWVPSGCNPNRRRDILSVGLPSQCLHARALATFQLH
jgi:hypothetical protein